MNQLLIELIEVQKKYIKLLEVDIDKNVVFLGIHGIRCTDEEANQGELLRDKIKELTSKISSENAK